MNSFHPCNKFDETKVITKITDGKFFPPIFSNSIKRKSKNMNQTFY